MKLSSESCASTTLARAEGQPPDRAGRAGARTSAAARRAPSAPSRAGSGRRRPTTAASDARPAQAPARASIAAGTPPACGGQRQQGGGDGAAERRGHVPQAEGEPALGRARTTTTTARPLAALALDPRAPAATSAGAERRGRAGERRQRRARRRRPRGRCEITARSPMRSARAPQPSSVATTRPSRPPAARPMAASERPNSVADLRRDGRQAELERRDARLGGHPDRQDHPAVAGAGLASGVSRRPVRRGGGRRSARWPRRPPSGSRASRSRGPRRP